MSRGFGKYRRGGGSHSSFHFDNLFKENSNRPSAARSAATVGKWGITSFTSIRTINGLSRSENDSSASAADTAPKPKKFFKSRNTEPPDLSTSRGSSRSASYSKSPSYSPPKKTRTTYEPSDRTTRAHSPRKFFSSKSSPTEKTVLSSNVNKTKNNEHEPPKPPIVLRICRGKSQLLNDSDESESTPTPSSTPSTSTVTSPRALKEPRPKNCRITRSARRSMQQDPSSSPVTADTPAEFSLFTSPRSENDLSPQYIPAEKYELERKAMYDNLLRPNSPKNSNTEPISNVNESFNSDNENQIMKEETIREEIINQEQEEKAMEVEEPLPETTVSALEYDEEVEQAEQVEVEDPVEEHSIVSPKPDQPVEVEPPRNPTIEEEWSSDTDSNSTAPEMEVKQIIPDPSFQVNQTDDEKGEILDEILEAPAAPAPPVKLVISKKKGSIFKSRTLVDDNGSKKRRALYRHKWTDDKEGEKDANKDNKEVSSGNTNDEFGFTDGPLEAVREEYEEGEVISIKCSKDDKKYYTVVRNVKKAHQIQEIGEFQEFNDDVEYILDALQDNNPISTRCLSAITLASKCMVPAFRMHVRAHGTVAKFFKALHDAAKDQVGQIV